jgi:hypothetical protein
VKDIERKDSLITVREDLIVKIQKFCTHGKYKNYPAPGI